MKIWIDDMRPAPEGYRWCRSVNEVKNLIEASEASVQRIANTSSRTGRWALTASITRITLEDIAKELAT